MTAQIPFNPRRFRTAAAHYLAGRPPYAPSLIRRVAESCGLRVEHRVLDLGCGPGQLSRAFAFFADSVVAIDPEPEMLLIAAEASAGTTPNVTFIQGNSDDLPGPFGRFRLATIGRAFHWMDRAATLSRLDSMIEIEGAVVLFDDDHLDVPDNDWHRIYSNLLESYADDDPDRVIRKANDWVRHEAIFLDSPFARLERLAVIERRRVSADRLVDRALSQSSTSRARIGERAEQLVDELRILLARLAPDGILTEMLESNAMIARRPPSGFAGSP